MDAAQLRPLIRAELLKPETDLAQVSAKAIRKSLAEQLPELDVKVRCPSSEL